MENIILAFSYVVFIYTYEHTHFVINQLHHSKLLFQVYQILLNLSNRIRKAAFDTYLPFVVSKFEGSWLKITQ